jgi:hypothetical protein
MKSLSRFNEKDLRALEVHRSIDALKESRLSEIMTQIRLLEAVNKFLYDFSLGPPMRVDRDRLKQARNLAQEMTVDRYELLEELIFLLTDTPDNA